MELKDLSSNWKKLQATFPQKKEASELKRKAPTTISTTTTSTKRLKSHAASTGSVVEKERKNTQMEGVSKLDSKGKPSASLALWAEENDIPLADLAEAYGGDSSKSPTTTTMQATQNLSSDKLNAGLSENVQLGKYLALDCEMVGVGPTPAESSALARVSIVNYHGHQVYDSFVRPCEFVTDWRTSISGISPHHMKSARSFQTVQRDVAHLLEGRILIGHALAHDLEALLLGHPRRDIRDTSRLKEFRKLSAGRTPSLKKLSWEVLGVEIQEGKHSSVEDARACMSLFRKEKAAFEREHAQRYPVRTAKLVEGPEGEKKTRKKKKKKGKK